MSQSESTATGGSPGGFYPSPPTSPPPVSTRGETFARRGVDTPKTTPKTHIITPREPAVKMIKNPPEDLTTPTEFTVSDTDELLAVEERLVLETWKRALSLCERRCGAIKWNNERCKKHIGAKKMENIDAVLDLLRRPGSSTDIETHLDSLSKLVHCHLHDHPPCRESRIEEWLSALPGSPRPPTVKRQLRNAFGPVPVKCTCMTKQRNPCKCNVSIANQKYCKKTVNVMVRIATAARGQDEDGTLADFAKVLQYYMMCGNHRKNVSKSTTQADWATAIDRFRAACHDEMSRRRSNIEKAGAISSTDEMGSAANGGVTNFARCFTRNGHARYWERGRDTNSFHILGKNDFDEYRDSEEAILDIAGSKLITDPKEFEHNEVHSGFVYLYKVPGNDAFVKVGFTTGAVQDRIEEWKQDCSRDPTVLYPTSTAAKTVLHAHRVERLVHAELMEHRIRHYCERCEKQHIEWFEVSADVAIAAIKKWSLWTAGKPYEETEGSEWHLKEAEKNRLGHVATFVEELQEAVKIAEPIKQAI